MIETTGDGSGWVWIRKISVRACGRAGSHAGVACGVGPSQELDWLMKCAQTRLHFRA